MAWKICIAGINCYTGQLLKKLINKHPNFEMVGSLGLVEQKNKEYTFILDKINTTNFDIDFLLLATPAETSIKILEKLQEKSIKIKTLDLSGALRLDKESLRLLHESRMQLKSDLESSNAILKNILGVNSSKKILKNFKVNQKTKKISKKGYDYKCHRI